MVATTRVTADEEGASPKELLLEAARRNNTGLLEDLLLGVDESSQADLLNNTTDGVGNTALHLAAKYGSYEVLDVLLDQEGLEVDPVDRMEHETPLHKAVLYAMNDRGHGQEIVELLVDAGADPRIRNKAKQRPIDIVDPREKELREFLQKAEYAMTVGNDVVQDDDDDANGAGSASDSE